MKTAKNTSQKRGALKKPENKTCCQVVALKDRSLLSPIQAGGLAAVFKVLANDTRLRLLHALVRDEELCVSQLAKSLGMKPQAISNQLNDYRTWGSSPLAERETTSITNWSTCACVPFWIKAFA